MRQVKGVMQRAYSIFEVKGVDEEKRIIEGIATTPTPDRDGDIVEPKGAIFALPMPLLWQHDSKSPVGHVIKAKPTKDGIPVTVKIFNTDEPGRVKDRLDEAWQSVKMGLVRAFSIGFIPKEHSRLGDTYSYRFLEWDWLELSLVTIPANVEATINNIKSADKPFLRAALGAQQNVVVRLDTPPPGAQGLPKLKGKAMKTIKERITEFENKRAAAVARMAAMMEKSAEEGTSFNDEETQEYDGLQAEVKGIDAHLARMRQHEANVAQTATPVPATTLVPVAGADPTKAASAARGGTIISVSRNLPKGTGFTRYAMALGAAKGDVLRALEISKRWRHDTPEVELALKAAVDPGTTTDATWAGPLAELQVLSSEFIELLRPETIIGRIAGFRRVPFQVKMPRQTAGSSAGWVGQNSPKPVSELAFDTVQLGFSKIAGIVVLTEELVRFSNPSAEAVVRQDLIDVISQYSDQQFIDPTVAAVANVSPASVTNGVTPRVSTANPTSAPTVAQITNDVKAVLTTVSNANLPISSAVWVMHPRTALTLSMLRTSQDVFAFPQLTMAGGTFFGIPVITSNNVPLSAITGDSTIIALIIASDILLADDGGVTLDVSREASLQMNSTPSAGAQSLVSLWQNNLVALKAERFINYQKRRSTSVQYISEVQY